MIKKIPKPEIDEECDWSGYFQRTIDRDIQLGLKPLKPRGKSCPDCPVVHGMYKEISDALKCQPESVRKFVSERWFCHASPHRSCQGNWDNSQIINCR